MLPTVVDTAAEEEEATTPVLALAAPDTAADTVADTVADALAMTEGTVMTISTTPLATAVVVAVATVAAVASSVSLISGTFAISAMAVSLVSGPVVAVGKGVDEGHVLLAQLAAYAEAANAALLFHASAIMRLLHGVRDVVEVKVSVMVVTLATSHVSTPVPVNLDA
jgi:hypothetical protein